jgi:NAD(P)-dependent dehydrogenase (short-subunit alcohol dehydrogenase family)
MNNEPTGQLELQRLDGQVAVVTGAGRGIGRGIALTLARAGAWVVTAARTTGEIEETSAMIQAEGGRALAVEVDVTEEKSVDAMFHQVLQTCQRVDLLVNNAAIVGDLAPIWEAPLENWWRVQEVNLKGPFLTARAILPAMVSRRSGRIINIASNMGVRPAATYSAYSVSKAGLIRLSDCLAEMTAPHNIQVFAISPGLVRTAMTASIPFYDNTPEEEYLPPERAGRLCAFLASGRADRLNGRYFHVMDDIESLVLRTDKILEKDLYAMRLNIFDDET